jgi:hypothetical protein
MILIEKKILTAERRIELSAQQAHTVNDCSTEIVDLGEQIIKVRNVLACGFDMKRKRFKWTATICLCYYDEYDCLRKSTIIYNGYNYI